MKYVNEFSLTMKVIAEMYCPINVVLMLCDGAVYSKLKYSLVFITSSEALH